MISENSFEFFKKNLKIRKIINFDSFLIAIWFENNTMMISNINTNQNFDFHQKLQNDEKIHYKGHGKLDSAPSGSSILHVISHELDHVAEYKAEAMRKGAEVRNVDVDIHYEIRNGKMVAVGGETKVTTASKSEQPKNSYDDIYIDSLFPTIEEINARKEAHSRKEIFEIPSDEEILKEKLDAIQSELKSVLTRAIFRDPEHKSIDDLRNDRKESSILHLKKSYEGQLEELKQKEKDVYSRTIATKIYDMQNSKKVAMMDMGNISISAGRLDLIA